MPILLGYFFHLLKDVRKFVATLQDCILIPSVNGIRMGMTGDLCINVLKKKKKRKEKVISFIFQLFKKSLFHFTPQWFIIFVFIWRKFMITVINKCTQQLVTLQFLADASVSQRLSMNQLQCN